MFAVGQEVMIIGCQRMPIGMVVRVAEVMPCDMGDAGVVGTYLTDPPIRLNGLLVAFQEQHLMPLDSNVVVQEVLLHLEA